jgi:penicillin-binding protein 2
LVWFKSPKANLRNYALEQFYFHKRMRFAGLMILLALILLIARFFFLQIGKYDYYHTQAENNRVALVPIVPNRGNVYDRNGQIIAQNYFVYTLELIPGRIENLDETIKQLSELMPIRDKDLKNFRKLRAQTHNFESVPIRTHLSETEAAVFAVNQYRFPGVSIKSRLFRFYPNGKTASHLIGYVGRINQADEKALEQMEISSNYKGSDHIGKAGIEQFYETILHGQTGFQQVEINADGQAERVLAVTPPKSGNNLILSIDMNMQKIAEDAFGDRRGALVAIDPKTGEVLAYVSMPTYDPNLFIDGIDADIWKQLNESLDKPLINRPIRGIYPPGSTFKPFVALAGMNEKKRLPPFSIADPGFYNLPGGAHQYRDWKPGGHGTVDIQKAITVSCDTFFYGLALDLGIEKLTGYVRHFGFGERSGLDMVGEMRGLLPTPEWKQQRYKQKWFAGETIIVGIGQGYTLVTPMQLAQAVSILANNGVAMRPHLLKTVEMPDKQKRYDIPQTQMDQVPMDSEAIEIVHKGMVDVTKPGGTAASVGAGAPYEIAAKTGTAQVVGIKQGAKYNAAALDEHHRDHALFIAFAPADDPQIAVAVIVENGGHGGTAAGPIARQVMDYFLLGKVGKAGAVAENNGRENQEQPHD